MNIFDVAIIGAGPVGIFASFQAGMLGMNSCIIDSLKYPGGQCATLYPDKPIYDIPGYPSITGGNLIDKLVEQSDRFNPKYFLNEKVVSYQKIDNVFNISTEIGTIIKAKTIIIAIGAGSFVPNKPPLENIEKFESSSIFYAVHNPARFENQVVAIAGGGDSAADWTIILSEVAKKIILIHRRANLRCMTSSETKIYDLINRGKVEFMQPYQISHLYGNEKLESIDITNIDGVEKKKIDVDSLLLFFGMANDIGEIKNWNLDMHGKYITTNQSNMSTSIDGIYAVGDVAHYQNKLKLILTGFSEVATAIHHAYGIANPEKALHFEHSTTKGQSW